MSEASSAGGSPAAVVPERHTALKVGRAVGATLGYGCLAAFLYLISIQIYRWFRDGEWTHFGVNEGIRLGLLRCCVNDSDTGRLAALVHWLDTPVEWLGLHRMLEVLPASLALFVLSILGNCVFVYCQDRMRDLKTS
jgi:hypothetical protein